MSEENQEIKIEDLSTEKKFFTQIPNIIHRMGLGPYIVAYYCLLKSIAGDSGSCFTGQKKLASALGCSDRQIRLMNDFMSKPFEILGGKPLIKITHRKNEDGECLPNLIHIIDIWIENIMVLKDKIPIPQTPMPKQESNIKKKFSAESSSTIPESSSTTPESSADKEEPKSNNPVNKISSKDLGIQTKAFKKHQKNLDVSIRWKLNQEQLEIFDFLKTCDIDADDAKLCFWAKTYPLQRLIDVFNEAKHNKARSLRKYMSNLLDGNKVVHNATIQANIDFAEEFMESHEWHGPKIFKKYIKIPNGSDFSEIDLNMKSSDFIYRLIEKYESSQGK